MSDIYSAYEETLRGFRLSFSRGGAVTGIVLILLGVGLDYGLYPHMQQQFAIARVLASIAIFCVLLVMLTAWGKEHINWVTFLWLFIPQIMISWMISVTEGATSLYNFGLHLAVYAAGIVLSFGLWQNIIFGAMTYVLYVIACATHPDTFELRGVFLVNSIFLFFSTAISTVFTIFNERARLTLFRLKAELERKNKALMEIKGQLLQQEKMAAIGTLSAGLLHEVNNPLNFCIMAVSLATEEPIAKENEVLNEYLTDAKEGMQRIQHIVSDLKTFAYRTDETTASAFVFSSALASAIRLTAHELRGIEVTQDLPPDTVVAGEEAAIIGVLINLLSNAANALQNAQRTEPRILISANWADDRLHVTVHDNGPGIAAENLSRVFEPFFTTQEIGHGLGLGLSISYGVIERHGGVLTAESTLGEWTKMRFDIPRKN